MAVSKGFMPEFSKIHLALVVAACSAASQSHAFSIDVGNPDFDIRLDTTAKYTAAWRVEGRESRLADHPNRDEGNYKFDKGDMIGSRVDLLTEMDVIFKRRYGFRVSAAGWYDHAYRDGSVEQSPAVADAGYDNSYDNNHYSGLVERYYHGPSGEILDAFIFANMDLGGTSLNVKAGRHTVYWGSATFDFFGQGINYGQAPMDTRKSAAVPGTTAKETFLPVNQISFQSQVLPTLSLAGQYFLDWKPTRFSEGGTYFGGTDFFFHGPDQFPLAPGYNARRIDDLEPDKKHGSFGLNATWLPDALKGGSLAVYYRQFDDPAPWLAPQVDTSNPAAPTYRLVYPEDIKMLGVGLNMNMYGASVGADLSFRKDAPLIATGINPVNNEGPRGETLHLLMNFVKGLTSTPFWDTGTIIGELSYSHLIDVTHNEQFFNGEGYGCGVGLDRDDGCATRNFWGVGMQFSPQWLQVFPGVDLSTPITARYGLGGNGSTSMSGNEGHYSVSVGLAADIYQKYKVQLTYSDTHNDVNSVVDGVAQTGNGGYANNDRGWVSLSLQTSF